MFVFDKESNYHIWACEAMLDLWYEVEILTYKTNLKIEEDPNYNKKIKVIYASSIFAAWKYLFKNRNALLYANTFTIPSLLSGIFVKKSIFFSHDPVFPKWFFKKIFVKFCYRFFSKIRVINTYEANRLKEEGYKDKALIIPLVVSEKNYNKTIKEESNILLLWSIIPKKDPITIIKALQIVIQKYPEIKIYQVGDYEKYVSPEWKSYKQLINKYDLEKNIKLFWRMKLQQIRDFPTSIYVNSSLSEWQCIAVYDAILLGHAVCLPKTSSFDGVFWKNVLYHEIKDYEILAKNILFYIEHTEIRRIHIQNNQEFVLENYNYKNIQEKIQKEFSRL